ncbi:metal-dependent hydrolase [Robertmurraya sp. DFI.2.37]|uniref:metal-dependent hydrolase n=1 Tax=Robertmurraya sp. DFI.2.37 TaxID=3031819 RepID=UPI001246D361|nr:metal-dependent hydrolase [Robertmurraya sp. DFI.2.37]MDF1508750.1 metal-dependent hydrolase [Robertmurraya sp. DFI.2.37]
MKISYHGHAVVKVETSGKTILIDPFINGNGLTDLKVDELNPDYIILTHGHNDHVGDTEELARKSGALIIGSPELATYFHWKGLKTHGMNIGGSYEFDFGKVKFTQAYHSTGYETADQQILYLGMPMGVLLTIDGKTIYHAGDTALFSDMKLIGERHPIELAFLPIGDNYTMGPEDAAYAAQLLGAKTVVPIHYNTFPVIRQDPYQFVSMLPSEQGKVLEPGQGIKW